MFYIYIYKLYLQSKDCCVFIVNCSLDIFWHANGLHHKGGLAMQMACLEVIGY